MHQIRLSPTILARIEERRGRRHVFDRLEPSRTALLVVDMQNCFCMPDQPAYVETTADIVPNITSLADVLREAGGLVVWIQMAATQASQQEWNVYFDYFNGPDMRQRMIEALTPGSVGYALHPDLKPASQDLISVKSRFSALIQGSSDLDTLLRQRGIEALFVTGTVTNVCCESTARDATMLNYKTIFISDGNAARTDDEHNATLNNLLNIFCDVRSTEEAIGLVTEAMSPDQRADRS
jgi:ureidoacrylate peracid hydrolase